MIKVVHTSPVGRICERQLVTSFILNHEGRPGGERSDNVENCESKKASQYNKFFNVPSTKTNTRTKVNPV